MAGRALIGLATVAALAAGGVVIAAALDDDAPKGGCSEPAGEGFELTYLAQPRLGESAETASLDATVEAICARGRAIGIEIAVRRRGEAIVVEAPEPDPIVTRTGTVRFYDWEPNVVGPNGRPGTGSPDRDGGIRSLYEAVRRAARARPLAEPADRPSDRGNDSEPARAYFFERGPGHAPVAGPDTRSPPAPAPESGIEMVTVPRGIVVLRAFRSPSRPPGTPPAYFVVEDDVELSNEQIGRVEQNFDVRTEAPNVVIDFEATGHERFERLTRRIVERGSERFIIALDDEIVSIATIDRRENPRGIDGQAGAQITGTGNLQDALALEVILRQGPLPVRLVLDRRRELGG